MRIAIIGGGIAGLAAAWELRHEADITIFDPGQLGGCIRTTPLEGHPVDEGPDAFLTRLPEAVQLCTELGIGAELVAPSAGRSMLWWDGRLRPLPEGLVLGVPRHLSRVLFAGVLSPAGAARAALDLVLPRRRPPSRLTVRELVADRLGGRVADRFVDPLVGGIHAGRTSELGAIEVVPQLVAVAERSRSLLLGLRRLPAAGTQPMFLAPRQGIGHLVDVAVRSLTEAGVVFSPEAVTDVRRATAAGQLEVSPDPVPFDGAVVATPARTAAALIRADGIEALARLPTASVALVTAVLPGVDLPPGVNGFLVPRLQGKLMTACSFASNKWPHWAVGNQAVVRVSVGRHGDPAVLDVDDSTLIDRLMSELSQALGLSVAPATVRVSRWPDSFPQYLPGHHERTAAVETRLIRQLPTVALAGSSYRGSGIPACIASGRRAGRCVLERARSSGA